MIAMMMGVLMIMIMINYNGRYIETMNLVLGSSVESNCFPK